MLSLVLFLTPPAHATPGDPPPLIAGKASHLLFSVPGVINNQLATVVSCTNVTKTGTADITVGLALFHADGTAAQSGTTSMGPGATVNFSTSAILALPGTVNLNADTLLSGSAIIYASAGSGIVCTAFNTDSTADPPRVMNAVAVVKKVVQKGE